MDWGWWVGFLVPLGMGGVSMWWLRGEYERDRQERIQAARRRHPGYRHG